MSNNNAVYGLRPIIRSYFLAQISVGFTLPSQENSSLKGKNFEEINEHLLFFVILLLIGLF